MRCCEVRRHRGGFKSLAHWLFGCSSLWGAREHVRVAQALRRMTTIAIRSNPEFGMPTSAARWGRPTGQCETGGGGAGFILAARWSCWAATTAPVRVGSRHRLAGRAPAEGTAAAQRRRRWVRSVAGSDAEIEHRREHRRRNVRAARSLPAGPGSGTHGIRGIAKPHRATSAAVAA